MSKMQNLQFRLKGCAISLHENRVITGLNIFSSICVDVFGNFVVRRGRSRIVRYGLIAVCLVSRSAHIELLEDLSSNAFLNALRRMICRRPNRKYIFSDNGTNFVGSQTAFRELYSNVYQKLVGQ